MSGSITAKTYNNVDNHVIKLYRTVSGLFDVNNVNNKFSDVALKIGSKIFYCHKFLLSLSSKYFANFSFLSKTWWLPNVNPDYFYDVLQFIYTGEVVVSTNNIESIITAADILGLDDLKQLAFKFLEDGLSVDNALAYWQLAQQYGLPKLAERCISDVYATNVSLEMMATMLSKLDVKSEMEVCEMLMKWLKVQTEAEHEVHPDQLLPLIRWSGMDVEYIKSKLLQNTTLASDPASVSFLTKVITYLQSGVQFKGLRTFHRPSTGLERCLVTLGLGEGTTTTSEVCRVSLQHPDKENPLTFMPIELSSGSCASLLNNNVFITGVGVLPYKQTWSWNILLSSWSRCADMLTGREYHCVAGDDANSTLFMLGGWVYINNETLSSVESYDAKTNKWSASGKLIHAVRHAACVTYKNSIYVFGGEDKNDRDVSHVQIFSTAQESGALMEKSMPRAYSHLRAVLWETSVILLGRYTCLMYNFETETWLEREQFKTGVFFFASTLDNSTVYIAGGGTAQRDKDNMVIWTCTREIKSAPVVDIVKDKPAVWKHHAKLIKPCLIKSYVSISLPDSTSAESTL